MSEEWRDVIGYEGIYQVSSVGRVKRIARGCGTQVGRILRPRPHVFGYHQIHLSVKGKKKNCLIHRLVAHAFLGAPPEGHQVNHKNGEPSDNRVCNLEWVTSRENHLHAYRKLGRKSYGRGLPGEGNGSAKLSVEQVCSIRQLYTTGMYTQRELGHNFGVSRRAIGKVVHRETWKHI